jgi:6-phosphogluconolactonase
MIKIFSTPEKTIINFAKELKSLIDKKTSEKKNFYLALSGGSTPQLLFKELKKNYAKSIDWQFVHIYWGDERCVAPESEESNYGIANKLLLRYLDIPGENIHRIKGEEKPKVEARRYSGEIMMTVPSKNNLPKFDLIILGLGTDGHTASIFPNQIKLLESENYCEVASQPETKQKRITITGKIISNAENIYFLVTGRNKSEIVSEIIKNSKNSKKYPASHVHSTWGKLNWYLDEAAGYLI